MEIFDLNESKGYDKHRCLDGKFVDFYTHDCRNDIVSRIEDAIHSRDGAHSRTDERIHYNGLLSILRRKLRDIDKGLTMLQAELEEETVNESSQRRQVVKAGDLESGKRILKLAGLF